MNDRIFRKRALAVFLPRSNKSNLIPKGSGCDSLNRFGEGNHNSTN